MPAARLSRIRYQTALAAYVFRLPTEDESLLRRQLEVARVAWEHALGR